jgi:hypothetical protein
MSGATGPTFASALCVLRDRWEQLNATARALEGLPVLSTAKAELSAAMGELADAVCALEKIAEGSRKGTAKAKAAAAQTGLEPAPARATKAAAAEKGGGGEKKCRGRPPKVKARPDAPPPELFASEFAEAEDADEAPGDGADAEDPPGAAAHGYAHTGNGAAVVPEA